MMPYNRPGHHNYYRPYRSSRRPFRLPWILMPFLFFWFAGGHLWWLLPVSLFIMFLLIVIQRVAWSGSQQMNYNPSQLPYQSYQQDQPHEQGDTYQPYHQGYQTQQALPSSEREYSPERLSEDASQSYDQPRAEYPQQMPPM